MCRVRGPVAVCIGGALLPSNVTGASFSSLTPNFANWGDLPDVASHVLTLPATTIDGKPLDIAIRPGWKVVYFWSAECPCVKACEEYSLKPLARKYAGKVAFYAVCGNGYDLGKPQSELTAAVQAHALPYPVVFDRTHATAKALDAQVTPEVFLISPDNRIVFYGMPDDSKRFLTQTRKHGYMKTYLSTALAQALSGEPVVPSHIELEGCLIAW